MSQEFLQSDLNMSYRIRERAKQILKEIPPELKELIDAMQPYDQG